MDSRPPVIALQLVVDYSALVVEGERLQEFGQKLHLFLLTDFIVHDDARQVFGILLIVSLLSHRKLYSSG